MSSFRGSLAAVVVVVDQGRFACCRWNIVFHLSCSSLSPSNVPSSHLDHRHMSFPSLSSPTSHYLCTIISHANRCLLVYVLPPCFVVSVLSDVLRVVCSLSLPSYSLSYPRVVAAPPL